MISAKSRVTLPSGVFEVVGEPEDYSTGPFPTPVVTGTRREVSVEEWTATGEDAHGNETGTWSGPVPLAVLGWAPATAPKAIGGGETIVDVELYIPPYVINLRRAGTR